MFNIKCKCNLNGREIRGGIKLFLIKIVVLNAQAESKFKTSNYNNSHSEEANVWHDGTGVDKDR